MLILPDEGVTYLTPPSLMFQGADAPLWPFLSPPASRFSLTEEISQIWGQALSPHTFMQCVNAVLAPLCFQGIQLLNYRDGPHILAQQQATVSCLHI